MNDALSIYLDESGDLGFNFDNKGTPRYFVISLLVCKNRTTIELFKDAIRKTLKNKIGTKKSNSRELKGNDSTLLVKQYFYRQIESSKDWHVYAIVLDKHKYKHKINLLPREYEIYNSLSKKIITETGLEKIKSRFLLVADKRSKHQTTEFNKALFDYLDSILPTNVLRNIVHEDSSKDALLQSVDLFCWGIWKFYEHQDDSWISVFKNRLTLIESDNFLKSEKRRSLKSVVLTF